MKKIGLTAFILLFAQFCALAQSPGGGTPGAIDDSTPIPSLSGTLTTNVLGESISIAVDPATQRTFQLATGLVIVGASGDAVEPIAVPSGARVTLKFVKEGEELVVDRIFLEQE